MTRLFCFSGYAQDLPELWEKEKQIAKDMKDNILTDGAIKKMTLNTLFDRYMATRKLAESTRINYTNIWNNRVKDEIGNIKVVQLLPSHVKAYYAKLSRAGYAYSTIKFIHNMLYPALEMEVDDDIIRKNPAKGSISDYGRPLMPSAVNNVLYNIVDAYNKEEVTAAKKQHRKAELLPKISAHIMRHTACTRMAECRMDIKVLQYLMGHAHIDVTMEVYNHLGDMARVENEIAKLNSMAANF